MIFQTSMIMFHVNLPGCCPFWETKEVLGLSGSHGSLNGTRLIGGGIKQYTSIGKFEGFPENNQCIVWVVWVGVM